MSNGKRTRASAALRPVSTWRGSAWWAAPIRDPRACLSTWIPSPWNSRRDHLLKRAVHGHQRLKVQVDKQALGSRIGAAHHADHRHVLTGRKAAEARVRLPFDIGGVEIDGALDRAVNGYFRQATIRRLGVRVRQSLSLKHDLRLAARDIGIADGMAVRAVELAVLGPVAAEEHRRVEIVVEPR